MLASVSEAIASAVLLPYRVDSSRPMQPMKAGMATCQRRSRRASALRPMSTMAAAAKA